MSSARVSLRVARVRNTSNVTRLLRCVLTLCACLLLMVLGARAQSTSASLSGTIVDRSGGLVPDVEVRVVNVNTNVVTSTKTNHAGVYSVPNLNPGRYRVLVTKNGFKQIDLRDITLNVQDSVNRNFTIDVGGVSETVVVNAGDRININTTDGSVSTVVDRQFVANTPLNGRSFQDLIALVPGVLEVGGSVATSGEFSVNGQRTEGNYFTVDGVSANTGATIGGGDIPGAGFSGSVPGETVLGTTQAMVSLDALQEFRANTSTYSAEYGRTPGGQFSFSTRSGTNDWHGSAYDYFRNEILDANNWFNKCGCFGSPVVPRLPERQNDFGGTLGGPLIIPKLYNGRDKTFFFFSYEGLRLLVPQSEQHIPVPDMALRQGAPTTLQPFLNAFPVPNGAEDGLNDGLAFYNLAYSAPSSINSTSIRLDHNFGEKLNVFGRFADTPSSGWNYPANGASRIVQSVSVRTLTVGLTATLTAAQTNSFRFNVTQNDNNQNEVLTNLGGATPISYSEIPGPPGQLISPANLGLSLGLGYGPSPAWGVGPSGARQRQYNLVDTHSWVIGAHQLKFGIDWRRLTTLIFQTQYSEGAGYNSEASVLNNSADSVFIESIASIYSPTGSVEPVYHNFSAFAEDDWKATPRLSVSLGLRWDVNPAPGNLKGARPYTLNQITNLATAELAPENTPLWKTDWHGFAPRVGLAYLLRQRGAHETVLRAGYGTFYDLGSAEGTKSFFAAVGSATFSSYSGVPFPLSPAQWIFPPPSIAPPYLGLIYGYDPNLRLPYTMQWNLALEQAIGEHQSLTVGYVGSGGRKLLATFQYIPASLGNQNFYAGLPAYVTSNAASSNYNALQVKYQVNVTHGVQMLASYTYSHSIDDATSNFQLNDALLHSSSDFDIRHNFQAAVTYDVPGHYSNSFAKAMLEHWGVDTRVSARTGLPVDITYNGFTNPITGVQQNSQPELVPGQPTYLYGQYPGGRVINYSAFTAPPPNQNGDTPRNFGRGFGAVGVNLAVRRNFPIRERLQLQFRAEAFNVFNRVNFGVIDSNVPDGPTTFGYAFNTLSVGALNSVYQSYGPRSLQLMLKLQF
jgi:hypothetical protein